jgi:solute carrier family 25 phosphate transporter 3
MVGQDKHDASYYMKCMVGGVLACGLTHAFITPLDLIKCRKQIDPKMYKSLGQGIQVIHQKEGIKGLFLGWQPTLIGYSMQGFGKFGFYEIFKDVYKKIFGSKAQKYQTTGFLLSSACAEVIADVLLCPMESLKVKMQTAPEGTFPRTLSGGYAEFNKLTLDGSNGWYKILGPLMARQVPYTMVKFGAFENTVKFCYRNIWTRPKESYSKATQLTITFLSGYFAGIFCAIISHPADTMVSKINNLPKTEPSASLGTNVAKIYGDIGFSGLWRGLGTRILMVGTLTGLQWWIYDSFKTAVGLQTTGGK